MAELLGLGEDDASLRRLPINKEHLKQENLVPAILIRDPSGQDLFVVPFNHIISFEYSTLENQVHMELFDPTYNMLSLLFFNLAQQSTYGMSTTIRWGYVNNPEISFAQGFTEVFASRFMSPAYKFYVLNVEEDPKPNGTYLRVNMVSRIFDPVMTTAFVNSTFVSSDLKNTANSTAANTIEKLKKAMGEKEFAQYQKTVDALKKNLNEFKPGVQSSVTDPNNPTAGVVVIEGKLTFAKIFNELMKIAENAQTRIGRRRDERWQRPLLITPDSVDDDYDYQIFEGRNNNVWMCLRRLVDIMVSKPIPSDAVRNDLHNKNQIPDPKTANVMVGGKMTLHSAKIKNASVRLAIKDGQKGKDISPEQVSAEQETFVFTSFKDAEYDYVLSGDDPPIATYVFFGGSTDFDPNNTSEILDYSIQMDSIASYFLDAGLFNLAAVSNPTTGASIKPKDPKNPKDFKDVNVKVPGEKTNEQSSTVNASGQQQATGSTDPSKESSKQGSTSVTVQATKSEIRQFNVPAVVGQDGGTMEKAAVEFLNILRTKVGKKFQPILDITIVGDPRYDVTIITGLKKIRLLFRNRFGEENQIYSGIYLIKNIKHTISGGQYKTMLHVIKNEIKGEQNTTAQPEDLEAAKKFDVSEDVRVALLRVSVSGSDLNLIVNIVAPVNNENQERITRILDLNVQDDRTKIKDSLLTQYNNLIKGKTKAETQVLLQDFSKGRVYTESGKKRTTNFKIKEIQFS